MVYLCNSTGKSPVKAVRCAVVATRALSTCYIDCVALEEWSSKGKDQQPKWERHWQY
jgi:hypothetical protein